MNKDLVRAEYRALKWARDNPDKNQDQFDDWWHPIGSRLRTVLVPRYMVRGDNGRFTLTDLGRAELQKSQPLE